MTSDLHCRECGAEVGLDAYIKNTHCHPTLPTPSEVETVARAIHEQRQTETPRVPDLPWAEVSDHLAVCMRGQARAAIAALNQHRMGVGSRE